MSRSLLRLVFVLTAISLLTFSFTALPGLAAPVPGLETSPAGETYPLKRITFARGATSAVVSRELPARSRARYILRALSGQLMDITVEGSARVRLTVTDADGRALTALEASSSAFRGYLPKNGDYVLEVASGKKPVSFTLNVSIPRRIQFETGATSAVPAGQLDKHQSLDYILRAEAGQLMEVSVAASPDPVISSTAGLQLMIAGADGTVLKSGRSEDLFYRDTLPSGQDYLVTVRAGNRPVSFTMSLIIPQRLRFEPGAVSATVRGTLRRSQAQYYVLRAREGQTMKVKVTSDEAVQLMLYGADGEVLRSGMGEGSSFTGDLPATQDYILVVKAGPTSTAFRLKVTIR